MFVTFTKPIREYYIISNQSVSMCPLTESAENKIIVDHRFVISDFIRQTVEDFKTKWIICHSVEP